MVLTRLNRQSEAIGYFRRVSTLDSKSPGAHLNLGVALANQFNLNGALQEFSEAVSLEPNSSAAHYNRGGVLFDLQRNEEAESELETAIRSDPSYADAWYLLGMIARHSGNTDQSIRYFEKAAALDPDNAYTLNMLGQELLRNGDAAGAIEQWRKAIEIQPHYNEALYNLAGLLMKSDPAEAKRLHARFESLQEQQHIMDRAQTLGNFALASANARDWPQAISQLKDALKACGACTALPLLHKNLGLIYCRAGDLRNGRAELLAAQKLSPEDVDIESTLQLLKSQKSTAVSETHE
jgi:tetratricopeptide (TPR) repeat protein